MRINAGGADTEVMFSRYYNSSDYTTTFWNSQFDLPYKFQVLPASTFAEFDGRTRVGSRTLLPIVIKNDQRRAGDRKYADRLDKVCGR
ncbi:hypothetical protein [Paenibacillus sp. Soil766]|uniref:hypothetical protein n=1 Tax=Paenibacillus sp. Soil766 TaxID=1736404 RepID=UPI001F34ED5F|nr:hypothetical protein [Paenibacillus sp. Soil766]